MSFPINLLSSYTLMEEEMGFWEVPTESSRISFQISCT